ncbi:MAG: AbrB/MazE/SpoVT family DNA-binding domain-containing protein [Methanosarcina sp.]
MVKLTQKRPGNYQVHIPIPILNALGWKEGAYLNFCVKDGRLCITELRQGPP